MEIAIYVCGAVAVLLGVAISFCLNYHWKTPLIWLSFSLVVVLALGAALFAHNKVFEAEKEQIESLSIKDPTEEKIAAMWEFFDRNRDDIENLLSKNNELISVTKDGEVIPLGKIDTNIIRVNWDNIKVTIESEKIRIDVHSMKIRHNKINNFHLYLEKKVWSKSTQLAVSPYRVVFIVLSEMKNYFIIGIGFEPF